MKQFKFILPAIIGVYACLNLSSCSKDDDVTSKNILGTWVCVESNAANASNYSNGFFVGEALVFYDDFFKEAFGEPYTPLEGFKSYQIYNYSPKLMSLFTLSNWIYFYDDEEPEFEGHFGAYYGRERLYTIQGKFAYNL